MKIPREKKFTITGLGEVTLATPTLGQVLDANAAANEQKSEIARGELFLTSLLALVAPGSVIKYDALSGDQKVEIARAVASLLGAENEFDKGHDDPNPATRLRRAHEDHWKSVFKPLTEAFTITPPLVDLDWVRKSFPDLSALAETMRTGLSVPNLDGFLKKVHPIPSSELLASLEVTGLDTPALYPASSVWRMRRADSSRNVMSDDEARWLKAYEMVMHAETRLRAFIRKKLGALSGDQWLAKLIPHPIRA